MAMGRQVSELYNSCLGSQWKYLDNVCRQFAWNLSMRIAYIVPYVPNRIRTRSYNLINQLASLGHEITVFTLGSSREDLIDALNLKGHRREVHYYAQPVWRSLLNAAAALPSRKPLQSVYSWSPAIARQITQRASRNEFDIVHVEHLRGSRFGLFLKSRLPNMPVVWDSVDCISHLFQQAAKQSRSFFGRFMTSFELSRTRRAEGDLACQFDHMLVTAPTDRNALLDLVPMGKSPSEISVLPNGVDLEYFHPSSEYQRDPETIIFSGKMSYHANISMAKYLRDEIMPRIWKFRPAALLNIVGKDPTPAIKKMMRDPRITVTGTVDDIRPFLWRATVSVVPLLYGAGIQNKILEAMATGTPVVTTCQALSALQALPGKDLFVSDDPDGFSQAVLQLMANRDLQQRTGNAGVIYARALHSWDSIANRLLTIYQQILDSNSG
jgi:polysaccharide biosynthesis protein PslH